MPRNLVLDNLEYELSQAHDKTPEEIIEIAHKIAQEARLSAIRQEVLANHIAGHKGYPMNHYSCKVIGPTELGTTENGSQYRRKKYIYTSRNNPEEEPIQIFEQNWFAGYGIPLPDGTGWVGLLDN